MKRYIRTICMLFSAALLFAACMDDDETEVTLYDDIAITDFEITTGTVWGTTGVGLSDYPFTIDHLNGNIYNVDSLPVGTDPASLVCSYSTKNNGLVYLDDMSGGRNLLTTTDAVDYSKNRNLYVVASDNSAERMYTVEVRIHKEEGDEFHWTRLADSPDLAELTGIKAVALGDSLIVFGQKGSSTVVYTTDIADAATWSKWNVLGQDAYKNIAAQDGKLYALDNGGLVCSADTGKTFVNVPFTYDAPDGGNGTLTQLVGAGTKELYALTTDGRIALSMDGGSHWTADAGTEEDKEWLPVQDIAFCCTQFSYADSTDYAVLAGNRSLTDEISKKDTSAVVWRKIAENASGSKAGKWTYMNVDENNIYPLPRMSGLAVFGYDGSLLALGGAGIGGCSLAPMSQLYESRDGGITWKENSSYSLPAGLDTGASSFAAVVDKNSNIWIVCGGTGQVWRGRMNRLGWANR